MSEVAIEPKRFAQRRRHPERHPLRYIWRDGAGSVCLRLRSLALSNGTLCDGGFAEAAAKRWTEIRLEQARSQLTSLGHATFSLAQIESLLVLGTSLTLSRKDSAKDLRYSAAEAADLPVLFALLREREVKRAGDVFSVMADSFATTAAALANLEGVGVGEEPEDFAEAEVEPSHGRKQQSKEKSK